MNNRHDIKNSLWYTKLNDLSSTDTYDIEEFILKFMIKGRLRERKKNARTFIRSFTRPINDVIQWKIKDGLCDQMRQEIWHAEDKKLGL